MLIALIWLVPRSGKATVLIVATWAELSAATAAVLRPTMLTVVSAPSSSAVIPLA